MIVEDNTLITDAPECIGRYTDDSFIEADGIYNDEGCITEDLKNKKKTKKVIKS